MNAPGAMTTYTGDDGGSTVSNVTSDGVSIPKDIGQGSQWAQTIIVTTDVGSSVIETYYTAVGFEYITVTVGDFHALKKKKGGTTQGVVLLGLSEKDVAGLNAFEQIPDVMERRRIMVTMGTVKRRTFFYIKKGTP